MRGLIISIGLLMMAGFSWSQNQFHLSQYMAHQPFINPAAMGSYQGLNGALFYKNQWVGFDGAPTFQGFNISSPLSGNKNHLGFTFVHDRAGATTNMDAAVSYAYAFQAGETGRMAFGLSASMRMLQGRYSEITTETANDPTFDSNTPLIMQPNFKFGTYYYTKKFYVGLSVPNLLKNTIENNGAYEGVTTFDFNDMHFYLHSGYTFDLNNKVQLAPSVLIKQTSASPTQFDVNLQAIFKEKFNFGFSYRSSKDLIGIIGYQISDVVKLSYAYDFTFSDLSNYSSGSHEIMLIFRKAKKEQTIIEAPRI